MGAPVPGLNAVDDSTAEALLSSLKTIDAAERRRHATVFNYWLSIRGNRQFPPIRDLDPLEISDAGPSSLLLEMIGGGEDAGIRHLGQAIKAGVEAEKISEAPSPSLLSCIANKLPIVAASRQAFAFEEEFTGDNGPTRCWVTLLPFSATGTWIDYVYGFVSLQPPPGAASEAAEPEAADDEAEEPQAAADSMEQDAAAIEESSADAIEPDPVELNPVEEPVAENSVDEEQAPEPINDEAMPDSEPTSEADSEPEPDAAELEPESTEREPEPEAAELEPESTEPEPEPAAAAPQPGFSAKLFDKLAGVSGFYGRSVEVQPTFPTEPVTSENVEPTTIVEGSLQDKLTEVRAKADEARMAKLRANAALYEGLSAAYDFALDAEEQAEDYLKLVEAQGLKIQLRSPMAPVVKLAFDGMCDSATIAQLETVLAWALKQDLPRGSLAERIEAEGGIGSILNGKAKAA